MLVLNRLFDEFVHHQIIDLLLSQSGRLRQLIKIKELPRYLSALFCPPSDVLLHVRWCESGCVYLVYDKIFEYSSDLVN